MEINFAPKVNRVGISDSSRLAWFKKGFVMSATLDPIGS
jgi:hypothetical protein